MMYEKKLGFQYESGVVLSGTALFFILFLERKFVGIENK